MAWKSTNTAPCHIWHAFSRGPSWNWVEDTWNSRELDDGIADCLANGSVNRQARASPAFRDGRKVPRWKANLDREIFRTLLTTSHAGAGTEPYNRQATAGPHRSGWCVTTGGKVYSALVAETCQCSGHGETRLLPRSCFCSRWFGQAGSLNQRKPSSSNRVAFAFRGAVVSVGTV